jgi:hypothetical protein
MIDFVLVSEGSILNIVERSIISMTKKSLRRDYFRLA